jgi:hypothetical protein
LLILSINIFQIYGALDRDQAAKSLSWLEKGSVFRMTPMTGAWDLSGSVRG